MPLIETLHAQEAIIGLWQMNETELQLLDMLENRAIYQSELDSFVSQKRRIEFLSVRLLLQQFLDLDEVRVGYEPSGKPYLIDSDYQLSISHTKGYAVVILHPSRRVAIDIEQRADKVMRLQSKFMNEAELEAIDSAHSLSYTLICWSAKESLFKWLSESAIDFREHLLITPFRVAESGCLNTFFNRNDNPLPIQVSYLNRQEYVLTWI